MISLNSNSDKFNFNLKLLSIKLSMIGLLCLAVLTIFHFRLNAQVQNKDEILNSALITGVSMGIPGMSVAIAYKDSLIWQGAAGYSDLIKKELVKTDDLFGIGSISKTFVTRVILQLVDEGKIDLNQTPAYYLHQEIVHRVPNIHKANIAQLINHESGIPTWEFQPEWIRDGRGDRMNLDHIWGKAETLEYITDDLLDADFEPGMYYEYSNTNYTLLGFIIEAVTGNDAMAEIRNRILKPLKLNQIYLESFEEIQGNLVHHYHYASPTFVKIAGIHSEFPEIRPFLIESTAGNLSPEWLAGGMVASASDLVRWAAAIKKGELLSPKMQVEVFTYHPPKIITNPNQQYLQGVSRSLNYYKGETAYGHSGGTLGFTAMMFWLENSDVTVVLLTNVGGMHSGLNPSPVSLFYKEVLLPSVFKYIQN